MSEVQLQNRPEQEQQIPQEQIQEETIQKRGSDTGSQRQNKVAPSPNQNVIDIELQNKEPRAIESVTVSSPQKVYQGPKNGVDISFDKLCYNLEIKQTNPETKKLEPKTLHILDNVQGICKQGQVTAILGSSGAGKTSLLNLLSKRISKTNKNVITGSIKANDYEYNYETFSEFASYVMQDDRLLETLTVREVLLFAARLKVKGTPEQQEARVDQVIRQLRLERCKNTLIGGKHIKAISGGERKRTSIAFEIVSNHQVLLLDEPTSGLDSFTAFLVINLLKQMAVEENKTIIFTIHQPSSDIWNLFDRVMLLVQGKLIYQGQGGNSVIDYFSRNGFKCPIHSNPSDYLMSIMHKEFPENRENFPVYYKNYDDQLKQPVAIEYDQRSLKDVPKVENIFSFSTETKQIVSRTLKQTLRNPMLFKARLGQTIFISLFVSALYYQLPDGKDDPDNMREQTDYTGFFFFQSVNLLMTSMMPMVLTFPEERAVFLKEENGKYYSISSYFFGRTLLEFPFLVLFPTIQSTIQFFMVGLKSNFTIYIKYLFANILISLVGNSLGLVTGSAFSDPKVASGMMPVFIMPFMLFAGFFANRDNLWAGVSWIEYISPFKYGFAAHVHNQFEETYFRPEPIDVLNLDTDYWQSCICLIAMFIGYRLLSFIFLYTFKKKLQ